MLYLIEQCLNGIQLGMLLFLLAAGLTLIFGIMDLVNLAHGSLYMIGAYFAATFAALTGSFIAGAVLALVATLVVGMVLEVVAIRRLYGRDHLDHVLGTFGLILFFNDLVRWIWGPAGMTLPLPNEMLTAVQVLPGVYYPAYRLVIIVSTLAVAFLLYVLVMRTRIGMLIRAGASNREMVGALGVNIKLLYTLVFGLGAALAGFAGLMQAPILTVQIGMGENILILAFVVIIIGGIGSIRGAFVAAIIVGLIDTIGRAFLPDLMRNFVSYSAGSSAGPALSSMMIYMLMAVVLVFRPEGLFPAAGKLRPGLSLGSRPATRLLPCCCCFWRCCRSIAPRSATPSCCRCSHAS
jgi:branched-chain amino acid transport system permease protein